MSSYHLGVFKTKEKNNERKYEESGGPRVRYPISKIKKKRRRDTLTILRVNSIAITSVGSVTYRHFIIRVVVTDH